MSAISNLGNTIYREQEGGSSVGEIEPLFAPLPPKVHMCILSFLDHDALMQLRWVSRAGRDLVTSVYTSTGAPFKIKKLKSCIPESSWFYNFNLCLTQQIGSGRAAEWWTERVITQTKWIQEGKLPVAGPHHITLRPILWKTATSQARDAPNPRQEAYIRAKIESMTNRLWSQSLSWPVERTPPRSMTINLREHDACFLCRSWLTGEKIDEMLKKCPTISDLRLLGDCYQTHRIGFDRNRSEAGFDPATPPSGFHPSTLPDLKKLYLYGRCFANSVTLTDILQCKALESLTIESPGQEASQEIITLLESWRNCPLKVLRLTDINMTDQCLQRLTRNCSNLSTLSSNFRYVTVDTMKYFLIMSKNLKILRASFEGERWGDGWTVSEDLVACLQNCTSLQYLELEYINLTEQVISLICEPQNLRVLHMSSVQRIDVKLEDIEGLLKKNTHLRSLGINDEDLWMIPDYRFFDFQDKFRAIRDKYLLHNYPWQCAYARSISM